MTTTMTASASTLDGNGRRATVVLNPSAGTKVGLPVTPGLDEAGVAAALDAVGIDAEVFPTGSEREAVALIRAAAVRDPETPIVAAGGDGTFRVVARTLLELGDGDADVVPPIGILPLGSVMNVARSLGIPRDAGAAARVIGDGVIRTIDAGEVAGVRAFFEGVEVGLHAELLAEAAALDAGDRLAPLRAIRTAVRYRPSRLTLRLAGGRRIETRALVTSVSNGPFAGLGFTVAPDARIGDGMLDIRVFERFSRWELLRHFVAIAAGRRRYEPRVRTFRSPSVLLETASPMRVHADGEDVGWTPVEIRARHRALRVIAPAP